MHSMNKAVFITEKVLNELKRHQIDSIRKMFFSWRHLAGAGTAGAPGNAGGRGRQHLPAPPYRHNCQFCVRCQNVRHISIMFCVARLAGHYGLEGGMLQTRHPTTQNAAGCSGTTKETDGKIWYRRIQRALTFYSSVIVLNTSFIIARRIHFFILHIHTFRIELCPPSCSVVSKMANFRCFLRALNLL